MSCKVTITDCYQLASGNIRVEGIAAEAVPRETPDVHGLVEMLALTDPYPLLREKSEEILVRSDRPKGHFDNAPSAED